MLVIRDAQLHVFAARADDRFFRGLVAWMRRAWWEQTIGRSDAELEARLRPVAARGAGFGVRREDELHAYLDLELRYGPGFEEKLPYALPILRDPALPGGAKVALIRQRAALG